MDPKLNFAHFCDIANTTENNKLNIIGIFKNILAENIPAMHLSMFFVAEIHLWKGTYKNISVKTDKGATLAEIKDKEVKEEAGEDVGILINLQNTVFDAYGVKKFPILVDGMKIGEPSITVMKPTA